MGLTALCIPKSQELHNWYLLMHSWGRRDESQLVGGGGGGEARLKKISTLTKQ